MIMAQKMKGVAMATNVELHQQNEALDRTRRLADRVEDGLTMNQARLDRFRRSVSRGWAYVVTDSMKIVCAVEDTLVTRELRALKISDLCIAA